jgi:hypothetical protein
MSRLARLRKPLEDMTAEEQYELIRRIRADRRITKERPKERRKAARSKDKDKTALAKLLEGMTPEEIAALVGDIEDAS